MADLKEPKIPLYSNNQESDRLDILPHVALAPEYADELEKQKRGRTRKTKIVEKDKYMCTCCGRKFDTQAKYFFRSKSTIYKANKNFLTVCKDCLSSLLEFYRYQFKDEREAFKRICLRFDYYFDENVFANAVREEPDKRLSTYIKLIAPQIGKTYDTYLNETYKVDISSSDVSGSTNKAQLERWGENIYTEEELKILDSHYRMLKSQNPNIDSNQEIFLKDLCILHLTKQKAIKSEDTKSILDCSKAYRDAFKQAGLRTNVETNVEEDTFGITLATISKYTPEEYYKDKELYKDFDGIGELFTRLVLRPLKNLLLGTNERDEEFYVKVDDEI